MRAGADEVLSSLLPADISSPSFSADDVSSCVDSISESVSLEAAEVEATSAVSADVEVSWEASPDDWSLPHPVPLKRQRPIRRMPHRTILKPDLKIVRARGRAKQNPLNHSGTYKGEENADSTPTTSVVLRKDRHSQIGTAHFNGATLKCQTVREKVYDGRVGGYSHWKRHRRVSRMVCPRTRGGDSDNRRRCPIRDPGRLKDPFKTDSKFPAQHAPRQLVLEAASSGES